MSRRLQKSVEGMTLVEVMVSVAILAIIGASLAAGFIQTAKNKKRFESDTDYYHSIRIAMERVQRELSMAYVSVHENPDPALVTSRTAFIGTDRRNRDRIDFTSFSHQRLYRDAKESDQNEISFFVTRHPEFRDQLVLARREQNRVDDDPQRGGRVQILLDDIKSFELEYLDPESWEWVRTWDTTQATRENNRLPAQVRITLVVPDLRNPDRERQFTTRAVLPIRYALNHARYR